MVTVLNQRCMRGLKCFALLTLVSISSFSTTVRATDQASTPEQSKAEIAKLLCQDEGALVRCAGIKGSECEKTLKAPIDKCSGEALNPGVLEADVTFMRCFWREFTKEHGQNFRYTKECAPPGGGDSPVMPLPPELQEGMRLLNPPKSGDIGW